MANGAIRGITVEIGGDTSKLGKAIEGSEKQSRSLQTELRQIENLLKFDPSNVELLSQKQKVLTQNIEETGNKLDVLKEAERQVIAQFERGEVAEEQVRALQREIIKTESVLGSMKDELNSTNRALENVADGTNTAEKNTKEYADSLENAQEELSAFKDQAGETFETIATGATVIAGAVTATAGYALNLSTEFDKAFNSLQAQTGATAEEMVALEEAMTNVYRNNFGENMEDVAQSMATIKNTVGDLIGAEGLEILTQDALLLRDTFDFEVNESIRAVNSLMNQFGIDGEYAYNLIAQGAQNGLNQNDDLLDTINEYSVQFAMMGYEADEMFNMLVNGAESGTWSVDKLGDAVKEFNIRTKDGSDSTAEAFAKLGLATGEHTEDILKATEKLESYEKQIEKLEKNIKYATLQQSEFTDKTSELTKIKTADNIASWSKELEGLRGKVSSTTDYIETLRELSGKQSAVELFQRFAEGGESARQATEEVLTALFSMEDKLRQDTVGVALFGTMWEDLGADAIRALMTTQGGIELTAEALEEINAIKYDDIGSAISGLKRTLETDIVEPLGDELKPVVEDVIEVVKSNAPQIKEVLSTVVSKVGEFVSYMVNNGPTVLSIITGVGVAFGAWKVASMIAGLIGTIASFVELIKKGATVMEALNKVMNANPIVLIVSLIAGLVVAFITLWNTSEEFRNFWIGLWENIKNVFSVVADSIKNFFTVTMPNAVNSVVTYFSSLPGKIQSAISNLVTIATNIFTNVKDAIMTKAQEIYSNLPAGFQLVVQNIQTIIQNLVTIFQNYFGIIKTVVQTVISVIKAIFSGDFASIPGIVSGALEKIKGFISNILDSAVTIVINWIAMIINYWRGWAETLLTVFNNLKEKVVAWWTDFKTAFTAKVREIIDAVVTFFKELPGKIYNAIITANEKVRSWGTQLITTAKTAISNLITNVVILALTLPDKIYNAILNTIAKVRSWGSSLISTGKTVISDFITNTISIAKTLPSKFIEIGKNVVEGLKSGITGAISGLYDTITSALSGLVDKAKSALGIHSPSRVFADVIGKMIPAGVAKGITDNAIIADNAVQDMTDELANHTINLNGATLNRKLSTTFGTGSGAVGFDNSTLFNKLDSIYERLTRLQIVLDTGTLVGETIDRIDAGLASNQLLRARGV